MLRLAPDVQVSPIGGIVMWLIIGLVVLGFIFTTGLGGFLAWVVMVVIGGLLLYAILSRITASVF